MCGLAFVGCIALRQDAWAHIVQRQLGLRRCWCTDSAAGPIDRVSPTARLTTHLEGAALQRVLEQVGPQAALAADGLAVVRAAAL
jgi:hypothetical protein